MKCPHCKSSNMAVTELEQNLSAHECSDCLGVWIKAANYWRWLQRHGESLPELPAEMTAALDVEDSTNAKVCPDCGHFLTRKQVGHGISFQIDRCTTCGGIWLDKNEWDILKSRNLHDEIHFVFSEAWQKEVLSEQQAEYRAKHAMEILGSADYNKLVDVKNWLSDHPQKEFIMAHIMAD